MSWCTAHQILVVRIPSLTCNRRHRSRFPQVLCLGVLQGTGFISLAGTSLCSSLDEAQLFVCGSVVGWAQVPAPFGASELVICSDVKVVAHLVCRYVSRCYVCLRMVYYLRPLWSELVILRYLIAWLIEVRELVHQVRGHRAAWTCVLLVASASSTESRDDIIDLKWSSDAGLGSSFIDSSDFDRLRHDYIINFNHWPLSVLLGPSCLFWPLGHWPVLPVPQVRLRACKDSWASATVNLRRVADCSSVFLQSMQDLGSECTLAGSSIWRLKFWSDFCNLCRHRRWTAVEVSGAWVLATLVVIIINCVILLPHFHLAVPCRILKSRRQPITLDFTIGLQNINSHIFESEIYL